MTNSHIPRIGENSLKPLSEADKRIAREVARLKDIRKEAAEAERAERRARRREVFSFRRVVAATGIIAVAAIGVRLTACSTEGSSTEPATITVYPGQNATEVARRALMLEEENFTPNASETNEAIEALKEANPDHTYGSGAATVFESGELVLPEDLTPQN